MTARRSTRETEIPLYLIPHVIARQIKERGDDVYRISVVRTHHHHYNVSVRTKPQYRELRIREDTCLSSGRQRPDSPDTKPCDESSGGAA